MNGQPTSGTITIKASVLYRAIRAVAIAMGDAKKRSNLHGILIETVDGETHIVATNGHYITQWIEETTQTTYERMYVHGSVVEAFTAWLKPLGEAEVTLSCRADTNLGLAEAGLARFGLPLNEAPFPPYDEIIDEPKVRGSLPAIGLDCKYMSDIALSAKRASTTSTATYLGLALGDSTYAPIRITSPQVPQWLTILMPVRV